MARNRKQTERLILAAFEAQIRDRGVGGAGINAVAKRAGVTKELIYRYFDGMPGLILSWMKEQDYWTKQVSSAEVDLSLTPERLVLEMLHGQIEILSRNDAVKEVRRWELVEHNEVTAKLARRRERAARAFIDRIDGLTPGMDAPAVVSVLLAGVLYLALRAKTETQFLGVPLRSAAGWRRFAAALDHLVAGAFPEDLKMKTLGELEAHRVAPARPKRRKAQAPLPS